VLSHSVFLDLDLGNLQKLSPLLFLTRALKSSNVRRQAVNCEFRRRQGEEIPLSCSCLIHALKSPRLNAVASCHSKRR